jgi:flagellar biosynthetic protein FlhB
VASREGKTEAPTAKRKKEARKKGNRPKSADLAGWVTLLACTYAVPSTVRNTRAVVVRALESMSGLSQQPDSRNVVPVLADALKGGLFATIPILLVCLLIGCLTHFGQTGLVLSLHPLKPDFKRINPLQGLKKLISPRSLWETGKQIVKSVVLIMVARPHIQAITARLTSHGKMELGSGISASVFELVGMIRSACWAILVIAIVDYGYQRRQHLRDLKMTKQEIRDEYRNSEGDQQVKQQVRSMQRALAMNRMMSAIPDATVVITNPTHIAIALRYDGSAAGGAPRIVAAGVDGMAVRIREKAHAAGVPIVESRPLAQALWRACDVGEEIPLVLYEAVAKVLAFVRRLRGGVLAASALPLPRTYDVERRTLDVIPARPRRGRLA